MDEEPKKKCALCGKEGALVVLGAVFGLVIIAMSVDTFFKLRAEGRDNEASEETEA